jgi:3-oxoadipate enol-lactonase
LPEVRLDGVRLHYRDVGAGPPVVLLHGFPLSSEVWSEVASLLAPDFRVVTPDLRGHGASDAPQGSYTMDVLAEDVVALADALGLQRFVLGGHSMGGYVAFRLAARWPERLEGLVLVATRAEADSAEARARRVAAAERIRSQGGRAFVQEFVPNLLSEHTRRARPAVVDRLLALASSVPDHVLAACLEGMMQRPDSRPLLGTLQIPALVVAGELDPVVPVESARAMAEALPTAQLVVIAQAGHVPSVEAPEATAAALRRFLAQRKP